MNLDATIEIIDEVIPHPDADRLDLAKILGYVCVTQKGLYKGGEKIVYAKPDAVLPFEKWTEEYRKYSPKRIKAAKLRGIWSEGIIIPFDILPNGDQIKDLETGSDVASLIGITHYEAPAPQDLQAKSSKLPHGIGKTDEERAENMLRKLPYGELVDISLKIDGSSNSFFYKIDTKEFGVLSRSMEIHEEFTNNYTHAIAKYDLKNKLIAYCEKHQVSLCIRGEVYGAGIQGHEHNPHAQLEKSWAMFSVFMIDEHEYAEKGHKHYYTNVATETGLPMVPMIEQDVVMTPELVTKYSTNITNIGGKPFEGVVFKHASGSFKVINKSYDSKK